MVLEKGKRYCFLKSKATFQIYLIVLFSLSLFFVNIDIASAQEVGCCENDGQGSYCLPTSQENCDGGSWSPVSCEFTSYCSTGCCISGLDGSFGDNVPQAACENSQNTAFHDGVSCETISYCQKGCCELGSSFIFNTEQSCQRLIDEYYPSLGIENAWDSGITDEYTCITQSIQDDEGCCVESDGIFNSCGWSTRGTCTTSGEENNQENSEGFYNDVFCSNPNLECSSCVAQSYKACDGNSNEDVYWFDSCGNREDLVDDCDPLGITGSGTICKEADGSASCESVDCEDTVDFIDNTHDPSMGGYRINGESWCTYEGPSGNFYDRPGSRHYRHICRDGEEVVEECKDFREQICVQGNIEINGDAISFGSCSLIDDFPKINLDKLNNKEDINKSLIYPGESDFENEELKLISTTTVDKGSKFWEGENEDECNKGKTSCKVIWVKSSYLGSWKSEVNSECEEDSFVGQAAEYCQMFGDCGADVNVIEEYSGKGLSVKWTGTGKGAHPKKVPSSKIEEWKNAEGIFGGLKLLSESYNKFLDNTVGSILGTGAVLGTLYATGYWALMVLTPILSGGASASVFGSFLAALGVSGPTGWIVLAVVVALVVIFGSEIGDFLVKYLWGSKTESKTITVTCNPFTAPSGGDDCEKCNEDARYDGEVYDNPVACGEYRCKSLGTSCGLINEGTPFQACVNEHVNDPTPPYIEPWDAIIPEPYTFQYTSNGYVIDQEVSYNDIFNFGIELNEHGQCRYDTQYGTAYEDMDTSFGEYQFSKQKNITGYFIGGTTYEYFVRCEDLAGNSNEIDYLIKFTTSNEPDIQPPQIISTSILDGAYLKHGTNETRLDLTLSEPVETCWWNKNFDANLEEVSINQTFVCGESDECMGILSGLESGSGVENLYYLRCEDLAGNRRVSGDTFTLMGSSELKIISLEPENGTYYTPTFDLRVVTSGGADNGNAVCYYNGVEFFNTGGSTHVQQQNRTAGTYEYSIFCEDIAQNEVEEVMSLTIDVDTNPPVVENLYSQNGNLYLITNEPSTCEYSVDNKYFVIGDGFEMSGVMVKEHSLAFVEDVYYIQCYDSFTNIGSTITVYNGS